MIQGLDHFALGAGDFEGQQEFLTRTLGLQLRRLGTRHGTGTRIAMLGDPASPFKVELIETRPGEPTGLLHVAVRVEDVEAEYLRLQSEGLQPIHAPHDLPAARARSALLQEASGLQIQIIQYDPDSPDIQ